MREPISEKKFDNIVVYSDFPYYVYYTILYYTIQTFQSKAELIQIVNKKRVNIDKIKLFFIFCKIFYFV